MASSNPPNKDNRLRIEYPAALNAIYANAAIINSTQSEIVIDLMQILPNDPRARVQARVAMTPANAKMLLNALQERIGHFEQLHGEIRLPARPPSLADQLFGGVAPDAKPDAPPEGPPEAPPETSPED
jgi:hypothetical protein